jgi:hypothetical protein
MPSLTIGDRRVTVGDDFLKLSPEQQSATVEEISKSFSAPSEPSKGLSNKASNFFNNVTPEGPISGVLALMRLAGQAKKGQVDLTSDEGINRAIPTVVEGSAAAATGPRAAGRLSASPAAKLVQDAAETAKVTGTAPQAEAASNGGPLADVLHSSAADMLSHVVPGGRLGLAALRTAVPRTAPEAPPTPPSPMQPWETPGLPKPGIETGPWGPWANAGKPTMPTKPPWQAPSLTDITPEQPAAQPAAPPAAPAQPPTATITALSKVNGKIKTTAPESSYISHTNPLGEESTLDLQSGHTAHDMSVPDAVKEIAGNSQYQVDHSALTDIIQSKADVAAKLARILPGNASVQQIWGDLLHVPNSDKAISAWTKNLVEYAPQIAPVISKIASGIVRKPYTRRTP